MTTLTLIRGLPGSGKSTLAQKLWQDVWSASLTDPTVIPPDRYEADDFFVNSYTNEYRFDSSLLGDAHNWCYENTLKTLRDGVDVIVSNTFTKVWEIKRYLELGDKIPDLEIRVIEVKTQYENIHGVSEEKIWEMSARWQDIPKDIIEKRSISVEVIQ